MLVQVIKKKFISQINLYSENEPQVKVQNIIKEGLGIDLKIQELNPNSKVFRISNIQ